MGLPDSAENMLENGSHEFKVRPEIWWGFFSSSHIYLHRCKADVHSQDFLGEHNEEEKEEEGSGGNNNEGGGGGEERKEEEKGHRIKVAQRDK